MKIMDFFKEAKNEENYLIEKRRYLHQYPELGYNEYNTQSFILQELKELSISSEKIAKTGVIAYINKDKTDKVIAIRADIDALPIKEENDFEYKSKHEGIMHACGHDAHTAILLTTAKILNKYKELLDGQVRFLFQPAEEGQGGAKLMIEEGAINGVSKIIALHVDSSLESGYIKVESGPVMASSDSFKIKIKGKGGHAASPYKTIDPIIIGSNIVLNIQNIISRQISTFDNAVISVSTFNAGTKENVIPSDAVLTGTVRTFSEDIQSLIRYKLERIVSNIVNIYEGKYEFIYEYGYPVLINNKEVVNEFLNYISQLSLNKLLSKESQKTMGAEDFAYYLQKVPGLMFRLGTGNEKKGTNYPHHHPKFNVDEDVLYLGVVLFLKFVFSNLVK